MDNATMPIVGDPETMNDNFLEQIVASAKAAIDKAAEMGVADPNKVGVGGHSYGAFMTANLLAHSDLFRAGIARSGAYNRTLTPFGFQSERRTIWEAPQVYAKVSPFMYANKINEPLLMIHGEADANPGTFPIQSERLFAAIKGNGGTARLVLLPKENHGYQARESSLHVLAEMIDWFDKYVKPERPAPAEASGTRNERIAPRPRRAAGRGPCGSRASGSRSASRGPAAPAGRNVNKVETKAEIRFVLWQADWIPGGTRARLAARRANDVNIAGELVITSSRTRSQSAEPRGLLRKARRLDRGGLARAQAPDPHENHPLRARAHAREQEARFPQRRGAAGAPKSEPKRSPEPHEVLLSHSSCSEWDQSHSYPIREWDQSHSSPNSPHSFASCGSGIYPTPTKAHLPFLTKAESDWLTGEISGDRSYEHVRWFSHYHRAVASAGLMSVAEYAEKKAKEYGLSEVKLVKTPP